MKLGAFWAGGGLGGAYTGVSCTLCDGRDTGFSGFLSAGFRCGAGPATPRPRMGRSRESPTTTPRSPFNGSDHFVDINANRISNPDGPEIWYTDPYGRNGRPEPFANSIRQQIAIGESESGVHDGGPVIGDDREYAGPGTRAPN